MACGAIAAVLGTVLNEVASSKEHGAMEHAVQGEVNRNRGFQNQAQGLFDTSLHQSDPAAAAGNIAAGQQHLGALIDRAQAVPLGVSLPSTQGLQDTARQQLSNHAVAGFGGYSNFGHQQQLKDMDVNSQLGMLNNRAQSWANILPAQLQGASQSQSGLHALGSLISTAGMLGSLGSLSAAPAAGASAVPMFGTGGTMGGFGAGTLGNTNPLMFDSSWLTGLNQ